MFRDWRRTMASLPAWTAEALAFAVMVLAISSRYDSVRLGLIPCCTHNGPNVANCHLAIVDSSVRTAVAGRRLFISSTVSESYKC